MSALPAQPYSELLNPKLTGIADKRSFVKPHVLACIVRVLEKSISLFTHIRRKFAMTVNILAIMAMITIIPVTMLYMSCYLIGVSSAVLIHVDLIQASANSNENMYPCVTVHRIRFLHCEGLKSNMQEGVYVYIVQSDVSYFMLLEVNCCQSWWSRSFDFALDEWHADFASNVWRSSWPMRAFGTGQLISIIICVENMNVAYNRLQIVIIDNQWYCVHIGYNVLS